MQRLFDLGRRLGNRSKDVLFTGLTRSWWARRMQGRVMVLVYHRIAYDHEHSFLAQGGCPTTSPEEFARDIDYLRDIGAVFYTFDDLLGGAFPKSDTIGVAITFDDGFRDSYERGLTILEDRGVRGTVFQCASMIHSDSILNEHLLYLLLAREGPGIVAKLGERLLGNEQKDQIAAPFDLLTSVSPSVLRSELEAHVNDRELLSDYANQVYPDSSVLRRALAKGHALGSHGCGHFHRNSLTNLEFEFELARSREIIEDQTGRRIHSFSFPFNSRREGDLSICTRYFKQVATVDSRPLEAGFDPLDMPRFTWPGPARNSLRHSRWLLTGKI